MSLIVCQTQPTLLAGVFIVRDILPCVLWNFNQLWFDSGLVGLEINVWYCFWKCEKLVLVPLQKFSATSQTLSLRHPDSATSDPLVAQRLRMAGPRAGRFEWQSFRQQNIRDFALWYSRFSVDCLLATLMVVGTALLMLKCISSYLACQYDSLSINKCSKIGHRGPRCEEMCYYEEFIIKKIFLCPQW